MASQKARKKGVWWGEGGCEEHAQSSGDKAAHVSEAIMSEA